MTTRASAARATETAGSAESAGAGEAAGPGEAAGTGRAARQAAARRPHGEAGAGFGGAADGAPAWERRFRAPRISLPGWAEDAPDRALYVSNVTGTFELYAWDRRTGGVRQVTDRPNGTTDGALTPDGEWVWWFCDTDGDEFGVWRRQPFAGAAPGQDRAAAPGLPAAYSAGLALGRDGTAVVGRSTEETGTTIHLVRPGGEPSEIYRHRESAGCRRPLARRQAARHRAHRARRRDARRPAGAAARRRPRR